MSLLAPLGLLFGLLSIPLLALYFLKIRRRKVRVPSTILWREFAKTERLATPFERFRRNLLLLLQLLLLLLLVLALSRPFFESDMVVDRSVILVVDVSASMGAEDVSPNRLGVAVEEAQALVDSLGEGTDAMLVVAGPQTRVQVPFTQEHDDLATALAGLEVAGARGSLKDGLMLALSVGKSRPGVEVVVYSDGGREDLSSVAATNGSVQYVKVGREDVNAGIVALDLRASPSSDLERQLFVTVQNFGRSPVDGELEVFLGSELIGLRKDTLAPSAATSMVFDLPAGARGELRAKLRADGDLLPLDDEAWAVVQEASKRRVLLVDGDRLTARALKADPRVELILASSSNVTSETLVEVDCTVFAGGIPPGLEGLDGLPYAVLGPRSGGPVDFGETAKRPEILGWRRTHPIQRFVSWDGVLVRKARSVVDSGGLLPLVESDRGPLVLAGERQGGRVVQLAFEPLDSDLLLRVAWPVFLMNTVSWLTENAVSGSGSLSIRAGEPFVRRLPDGVTADMVRLRGPGGEERPVTVSDGSVRVQDTSEIGIYDLRVQGRRVQFAANLHSDLESQIRPQLSLDLAEGSTEAAQATVLGRQELWRPLVLFGLLILLLEWWFWNRRRTG